jgi:hypothetical protein
VGHGYNGYSSNILANSPKPQEHDMTIVQACIVWIIAFATSGALDALWPKPIGIADFAGGTLLGTVALLTAFSVAKFFDRPHV